MGVMDFGTDDEEQQEEDGKASVSYIYVYEQGRDELQDKENYLTEAYEMMKSGGSVRHAFNSWARYDASVHTVFSHIVVGFGRIIEDGDFSKILNFLFEPESDDEAQMYGQVLGEWLQEHEDVLQAVVQTVESEETKPEAPADD